RLAQFGRPRIGVGCGPGFSGAAVGTDVLVNPSASPPASAIASTALPIHPGFPLNHRGRKTNAVLDDAVPARIASPSAHASDAKIQPADGSFAPNTTVWKYRCRIKPMTQIQPIASTTSGDSTGNATGTCARRRTTIASAASARKKMTGPHVPELHPVTVASALWYQGRKTEPASKTAKIPTPTSAHGLSTTGADSFDGTAGRGSAASSSAGTSVSQSAGGVSPTAIGRAGCSTSARLI